MRKNSKNPFQKRGGFGRGACVTVIPALVYMYEIPVMVRSAAGASDTEVFNLAAGQKRGIDCIEYIAVPFFSDRPA